MKFTPHFAMPGNFGGIPYELSEYKESKIVILPVPYDGTTTFRPGTRDGPAAIIKASQSMELYDEELEKNYSEGISTLDEMEPLDDAEKNSNRVYEAVQKLLSDAKTVVILGGEHSITPGAVKAMKEAYSDISVLQIDAHSDLRDENYGNRYNHGCAARRVLELCPIVEVGIRSMSEEEAEFIKAENIPVFYAADLFEDDAWMDDAISKLSERVYVTIDLDSLDPGIMPAVGTPEPGGLQWYQLLKFVRKLADKKKVVGFDVVELSPIPGNVASEALAAKLVYKLIGYFFSQD
jgi:agmatinase